MAIISPLTYTIANGQAVDATPLMADLNQIVSNVNANAAGLSQSNTYAGGTTQNFSSATTIVSASASGTAQAVPRDQADLIYAALAGNSGQVFSVAPAVSGSQAVNLGQFTESLATNGWFEFPNGIIVQGGQATPTAANTMQTFSFPIPFPNAALWFVCSSYNSGVGTYANGYIVSKSQFAVASNNSIANVSFIAVGN